LTLQDHIIPFLKSRTPHNSHKEKTQFYQPHILFVLQVYPFMR